MKVRMENYHAWFQNEKQNTAITVAVDGISVPHAEARAWIKFMGTLAFKEDEDNWKLEALDKVK
jgi:hypothetical protein